MVAEEREPCFLSIATTGAYLDSSKRDDIGAVLGLFPFCLTRLGVVVVW